MEGLTAAGGNEATENCDDARSVNIGQYLKYTSFHLACDAKSSAPKYPVHNSYKSNIFHRLRCSCSLADNASPMAPNVGIAKRQPPETNEQGVVRPLRPDALIYKSLHTTKPLYILLRIGI